MTPPQKKNPLKQFSLISQEKKLRKDQTSLLDPDWVRITGAILTMCLLRGKTWGKTKTQCPGILLNETSVGLASCLIIITSLIETEILFFSRTHMHSFMIQ